MFRFHVIFLIWWIILRYSLPRNIYFDSRRNSATALFGLNIDNLNKLASDLPYSIMIVNSEYILLIIILGILYWNGHNLFAHQLLGLYLCVRVSAVQFTSDVIRTIVRRRHRFALLRNT